MIDVEVMWINHHESFALAPTDPTPQLQPSSWRSPIPKSPLQGDIFDSDIVVLVSSNPAGGTTIFTRWTTSLVYNGYGIMPHGTHADYLRQLPGVKRWNAVCVKQSIPLGPITTAKYGDHYIYLYEVPDNLDGPFTAKYHYESITKWLERFEDDDDFRTFLRRFLLHADDVPTAAAAETPAGGSTTPLHGDIGDCNDDDDSPRR